MHCVKLLGQNLIARDFDRQVAQFQIRATVLNGYTALDRPVRRAGKRRHQARNMLVRDPIHPTSGYFRDQKRRTHQKILCQRANSGDNDIR